MVAVKTEDSDELPGVSEWSLECQNGHRLSFQDVHPGFLPFVRERFCTGEMQKPIHPDSCLICQATASASVYEVRQIAYAKAVVDIGESTF